MRRQTDRAGFTLLEAVAVLLLGGLAALMAVTVLGSAVMKVRAQVEAGDASLRAANCLAQVKAAFDRRDFRELDARAAAGTLVCTNGLKPRVTRAAAVTATDNRERLDVKKTTNRRADLRIVTISDNAVELTYVLSRQ